MKILIAPDSMKDALSAIEAAELMRQEILTIDPQAAIDLCPFSDGGEGLIAALHYAGKGKLHEIWVADPLRRKVKVSLLEMPEKEFVIEMAQASGLERLTASERNPLYTTTYGTGEMIKYALEQGARKVFLGMGGSATHDAGCGMAVALGVRFYDQAGALVDPTGLRLSEITTVDNSGVLSFEQVSFYGISDVTNPLLGERGAAHVYAAQKGADQSAIEHLEKGTEHLASLIEQQTGRLVSEQQGAGAAGGMGFGLVTFLHGKVLRGVEVLSTLFALHERISQVDLVVTLEGKTDLQTLQGKAPYCIGKMARSQGKKVLHFTGNWNSMLYQDFTEVFDVIMPIQDHPMDLQESINRTRDLLKHAVSRTFRLIKIGQLF